MFFQYLKLSWSLLFRRESGNLVLTVRRKIEFFLFLDKTKVTVGDSPKTDSSPSRFLYTVQNI
jgi:hypothetical protein